MKDITVLITAAGNVFMPGTTACLRNNGERNIRLIGADMSDDPTMLNMVDAYYAVPRGDLKLQILWYPLYFYCFPVSYP